VVGGDRDSLGNAYTGIVLPFGGKMCCFRVGKGRIKDFLGLEGRQPGVSCLFFDGVKEGSQGGSINS